MLVEYNWIIITMWDTDSNDWRAIEKTIGTIHSNGGISLRISYQWNVSVWDTVSKWKPWLTIL